MSLETVFFKYLYFQKISINILQKLETKIETIRTIASDAEAHNDIQKKKNNKQN